MVAVLLVVVVGGFLLSPMMSPAISFTDFMEKIETGEIVKVYANAFVWTGETATGVKYSVNAPSIHYYADWAAFVAQLPADKVANLTVEFSNPNA